MSKNRLDQELIKRGFVESRSKAQQLIRNGNVKVNTSLIMKPAYQIPYDAIIEISAGLEFVSRGGYKLKAALERFPIYTFGIVSADVGASTGGFTDCLLQRGVKKVYAIDVGCGELHSRLQNRPDVINMEQTNARLLEHLPETVTLVVIDVSFISLDHILPVVRNWFNDSPGDVIALVKPQFEAGKEVIKKSKGVLRDQTLHSKILLQVIQNSQRIGFDFSGLIPSPIKGTKGNVEFLMWLTIGKLTKRIDSYSAIEKAITEADSLRK